MIWQFLNAFTLILHIYLLLKFEPSKRVIKSFFYIIYLIFAISLIITIFLNKEI